MNESAARGQGEVRYILGRLRPPIESWRFWLIQVVVIIIFLIHIAGDGRLGIAPIAGMDRVVPFVAFFVPILYAALTFGFWGSVGTTAFATVLALYDTWLDAQRYSTYELTLILIQVALFDVVAVLVGERIEAEQLARATARAAAEGERAAKERYQALFEGSDAAIIIFDASGTIIETNRAARNLFSRSGAPLAGESVTRLVGDRVALQLLNGGPENIVAVRTEGHGTLLFHLARSATTDDRGAKVFQVVFQDMTEEHRRRRHAAAYAQTVLRGQEDERRRIAQELHDQPVQSLVHLCRGLDAVRDGDDLPDTARTRLQGLRGATEEIIESLRRIARGLRPPALDDLGLEACIRRLAGDLEERNGVVVTATFADHLDRLAPEIELAIFRIAQEALSNVERHAAAGSVAVGIDLDAQSVTLQVDDDGVGFEHPALINDPNYVPLGLVGMRERIELLGGSLEIASAPRRGTTVRAVAPLVMAATQVDIAVGADA